MQITSSFMQTSFSCMQTGSFCKHTDFYAYFTHRSVGTDVHCSRIEQEFVLHYAFVNTTSSLSTSATRSAKSLNNACVRFTQLRVNPSNLPEILYKWASVNSALSMNSAVWISFVYGAWMRKRSASEPPKIASCVSMRYPVSREIVISIRWGIPKKKPSGLKKIYSVKLILLVPFEARSTILFYAFPVDSTITIFPPARVKLSNRNNPKKYWFAFTFIAIYPLIPSNSLVPLSVKPIVIIHSTPPQP